MDKALLILIGAAGLVFIWLIWMRQVLLHHSRDAMMRRDILLQDLGKRRDIVPYLLESCRHESVQSNWSALLTARAHFHGLSTLEDEWNFERQLLDFMSQTPSKNLNFLEAKRDIEECGQLIQRAKQEFQESLDRLNREINRFPYSLASAMFGFRKLNP